MSVYAFPEFSYIPDIPIGTPEFQLWYRTQLRIRQELIQYLINTKYFDIILVDRHPVDEKIYAKRLGGREDVYYYLVPNEIHIYISRKIEDIIESLRKRAELEDQSHRKEWNEDDIEYLTEINEEFDMLYQETRNEHKAMGYKYYISKIINDDLDIAVTDALKTILRSIN